MAILSDSDSIKLPLTFLRKVSSLETDLLGDPGLEFDLEYLLPRSRLLGDIDCLLESDPSPIT